jgi:homocysteine S-methyltransferase
VGLTPISRAEKSHFARALAAREFAVVAEVVAPRGLDLSLPVAQARRFSSLGAVAVNVPDYPSSGARASALALASGLERAGVEPVLHSTCRDRTLMGLQSDLVGAHAMGVRNVIVTTGSPVQLGAYPDATRVFEVDSVGLLTLVAHLNRGLDIGGRSLGAPTAFHVGIVVNPFAPDHEIEWRRLQKKIDGGAEFIVTPPVLDIEAFLPSLSRLTQTGLPVIAGIAAIDGLRHAEFMASEVTGVRVAETVLERLRGATDQPSEALAITLEIVSSLRPHVQGLQVTAYHGSASSAERLLLELGLTPGATRVVEASAHE